ncbi:MAG: RNA polymerase sigma factor [Verrucomicrobiales bacterium]
MTAPAPRCDAALLDDWARAGCEASFRRLVERHAGLVFSTARRIVQDTPLAEDVAQRVFLHLAHEAGKLDASHGLAGWLHRTTTFAAMNTRRSERRRQDRLLLLAREPQTAAESEWQDVMPLVDEGLESLGGKDRQVVLLHYYEGLSFREVAVRLGTTAEAAQKRCRRALEKLTRWLRRRDVAVTNATLAMGLAAHMAEAAPAGLAAALSQKSVALLASGGGAASVISPLYPTTMAFAKFTTAAAVAAFVLPIGWQWRENALVAARAVPRTTGGLSGARIASGAQPPPLAGGRRSETAVAASLSQRLSALASAIAQLDSADDRLGLLKVKRLIFELPAEELPGAFTLVRAVNQPALALSLAETVFARWGQTAPLDGLAAVRAPAVRAWRASRHQEAGIDHVGAVGLFQSWALHDAEAALAAAQTWDAEFAAPGNRQTAEVPRLLAHLASIRPLDAMTRALALPAGPVRDLAETLVRQAWTQSDPAAALRWSQENTPPDEHPIVLGKIMDQMAGTNPLRAVELAPTLENPHARRDAAQFALMQLAPNNPHAAVEALLGLPDEMQTPDLLRHVAMFIAWGDPQTAAAAAGRLPEGAQRDAYAEHVARGWWGQDREACSEWLATSPSVSAAVRGRVLADLEKSGSENSGIQ